MEQFWDVYEQYIKDNPIGERKGDYLIKDGLDPLHEMQYFEAESGNKVLFILKESDEKDVDSDDKTNRSVFGDGKWFGLYKEERTKENKKSSRNDNMLTKMIRMYKYIIEANIRKENDSLKDDKSKEDYIRAIQTNKEDVYKFAFINVNKRGNGTDKSNDADIKKIVRKDAPLLRKQVEYLNPDVIVIGGKPIAQNVEDEIIKKASLRKKPIVLHVKHFSRMGYGEFITECKQKGL